MYLHDENENEVNGSLALYPTYIDDDLSYHTSDEESSDVEDDNDDVDVDVEKSEKLIEASKQNSKFKEMPSTSREEQDGNDTDDDKVTGDIAMERLLEEAGISTSNNDQELTPEEVKRVVHLLSQSNPELESYLHENILSRFE